MKSGLENKRNVVILAVLAVVMIGAVLYFVKTMFVGSPTPAPAQQQTASTPAPEPTAAPQAEEREQGGGHAAQKLPPLEKLDPTLHPEVMAGAESLEYSGSGAKHFFAGECSGGDSEADRVGQTGARGGGDGAPGTAASAAHRFEVFWIRGE